MRQGLERLGLEYRAGLVRSIVHGHIQSLYRFGFVEYQAVTVKGQETRYEIIGDPDPSQSTLTLHGPRQRSPLNYADGVSQHAQFGYTLQRYVQQGKNSFTYQDLQAEAGLELSVPNMHLLLGIMVREGVLRRLHKISLSEDNPLSKVSLDEQQREIIRRTANFHRGLRSGDPTVIDDGHTLGRQIMNDRGLVRQLLQRGFERSPTPTAEASRNERVQSARFCSATREQR